MPVLLPKHWPGFSRANRYQSLRRDTGKSNPVITRDVFRAELTDLETRFRSTVLTDYFPVLFSVLLKSLSSCSKVSPISFRVRECNIFGGLVRDRKCWAGWLLRLLCESTSTLPPRYPRRRWLFFRRCEKSDASGETCTQHCSLSVLCPCFSQRIGRILAAPTVIDRLGVIPDDRSPW